MKFGFFNTNRAAAKNRTAKKSKSSLRNNRKNLPVEHLEDRQMMSVSGWGDSWAGPAGRALINSLADSTIRATALADYNGDGAIDRNEMMGIFKAGTHQNQYLTSTEFKDLQTLVSAASTVGMPDYVQNLASKVLYHGPAFSLYQHGMLDWSPSNPFFFNSEIYAAQGLSSQVNIWFKGTERPDAAMRHTDFTTPVPTTTITSKPVYQQVSSLPLFAKDSKGVPVPVYQDVHMGEVSDCWLMASLAEVAARNPKAITDMFIDNHDGTYTVRFFKSVPNIMDTGPGELLVPDWVTVDKYLPWESSGSYSPNGGFKDTSHYAYDAPINDMWAALAEKAYAQECGSGSVGTYWHRSNSYGALEGTNGKGGEASWALKAITGKEVSDGGIPATYTMSDIATAWSQGQYVVLNSAPLADPVKGLPGPTSPLVVPHHSYAMVGYANGTFTLYNPWGVANGTTFPGFVWGTAKGIADNFAWGFTVNAGAAASFTVPSMATPGALPAAGTKLVGSAFNQAQSSFAQSADNSPGATGRFVARSEADSAVLAAISQAHDQPVASRPATVDAALTDMFVTVEATKAKKFAAVDAALADLFATT